MSDYVISCVYPNDQRAMAQIDELLKNEGIERDSNLDYTCAMFDQDYRVIGTGSCFKNTLRCFAVSADHQGEGLLNELITHLIGVQYERGNIHLFVYTKIASAKFFSDLGFHEIARVRDVLVFMENRRNGFSEYLDRLKSTAKQGRSASIVMNANPFTLGHQYLVEKAAAECDTLHLFVVSEDSSLIPFAVRKQLVEKGVSHLNNVIVHESGPYIISNATFPSYFIKEKTAVIEAHAGLDVEVFKRIASVLNVSARFVGSEPDSLVTGIYNNVMEEELPKAGIECRVIPRLEVSGNAVSASDVRKCLKTGDKEGLAALVPKTTLDYFCSEEALPVIEKIMKSDNVVHY